MLRHLCKPFVKSVPAVGGSRFASTRSKIYPSGVDALQGMKDGAVVMCAGFGVAGVPENILNAIAKMKTKDLYFITNSAGLTDWGHGPLLAAGQITGMMATYIGENPLFESRYLNGNISVEFIPQGSLCEKLRCGQAGIAGFYTPTGVGTIIADGNFPKRMNADGSVKDLTTNKELRVIDGKEYVFEESLTADFGLMKAYQGDRHGNLRFRKTARNFNPDIAGSGNITVCECEEIVDELDPQHIHIPGILVDRIFKSEVISKKIERLRTRKPEGATGSGKAEAAKKPNPKHEKRERIIKRAIQEFSDGCYANLGIGIPTMAANYVMGVIETNLQSENGLVGIGPYPLEGDADSDLINAGKETVTAVDGACFTRSSDAFGMMRGKHLHLTMLGSMQVSSSGDIANWIIPGEKVKGMGGAMDLVTCGSKVIVTMEHTTNTGGHKIFDKCSLPLTGKGVVSRVITEIAVFDIEDGKMILTEIAKGITLEDVKAATAATYTVAHDLKQIQI
jgi:3-oxoacid CoA-transferase